MAKHFLNISNEDFNFILIGISCPEDQYQVANYISDGLKIDLCLNNYFPFLVSASKIFNFSLFHFSDETLGLDYFFIPNTSNIEETNSYTYNNNDLFSDIDVDEQVKLIKELPKTDYFLILKGEDLNLFHFKIIEALKKIKSFNSIQDLEIDLLPSKRNLIF